MPPKKASGTAAKADIAKKQKQVEDKTFGLKNKNKSKQVQKHVQQMQQGVSNLKKQTGIDDHKNAVKVRNYCEFRVFYIEKSGKSGRDWSLRQCNGQYTSACH